MLRLSFCRVEMLVDLRTSYKVVHEAKLVLDVVFSPGYNRFRRKEDWIILRSSKYFEVHKIER